MAQDDARWMSLAVDLAKLCPASEGAYSVGAVIVDEDGQEISRGFSREAGDPHVHAEESALGKLPAGDPRVARATIYSTLEACSQRKSRPRTCTQLILAAGIPRAIAERLIVIGHTGFTFLNVALADADARDRFAAEVMPLGCGMSIGVACRFSASRDGLRLPQPQRTPRESSAARFACTDATARNASRR